MSLTGFKPSYCLHLFQQRPPIYGSPDMLHEMVFPGNWRFVAARCWANLLVPIFPTAFAHFMFLLSHVGNSCSVSNFFIIICYGDLWSVIFVTIGIVWGTMNCAYVRQPADKLFMKGGINLGGKFHCCLILRNCHSHPSLHQTLPWWGSSHPH